MAKKQTRRSISVSRTTYERLKAFCEANNISMSQFVETRVGDFLGDDGDSTNAGRTTTVPTSPRPTAPAPAKPGVTPGGAPKSSASPDGRPSTPSMTAPAQQVPMTSAAARFAVEPPPPVIKPKQEQPAPKPAEKRPDQIFTF